MYKKKRKTFPSVQRDNRANAQTIPHKIQNIFDETKKKELQNTRYRRGEDGLCELSFLCRKVFFF